MRDLISVVIPVYNVERYLQRCLNSVVSQTYKNLEIILVDDGSTDLSGKICDEWASKDNRIVVIHKTNGGLSSARNTGLDVAKGRYIAFVDSDDYINPEMYEIMVKLLKKSNSQIACCGRKRVGNSGGYFQNTLEKPMVISGEEAIDRLLCHAGIDEAAWDKLYVGDLFLDKRYPIGELNEDIVLTTKLLGECSSVIHVGAALYNYCCNDGSITNSGLTPAKFVMLSHLDEIKAYLSCFHPALLDNYFLLEERYTKELLYLLLASKANKTQYKSIYKNTLNRFRNAWSVSVLKLHKSIDIKGLLIFIGLYYPIHQIKNWRK